MRNKTSDSSDGSELPFINATTYYDTQGAASALGLTEAQLRQWRHRNFGPKYQQPSKHSRCLYLGAWLIQFRHDSIVDPSAGGR